MNTNQKSVFILFMKIHIYSSFESNRNKFTFFDECDSSRMKKSELVQRENKINNKK